MAQINSERIWQRLNTLAEIGCDPSGGLSRFSFTKDYFQACELVQEWMQEAGMTVSFDAAGNLIGRKDSVKHLPVVAMGSHIDTVKNGGMFDGCVGVVSAIEVVQALNESGLNYDYPIEVIAFSEEEGSRFGAGLLGSRALVGEIDSSFLFHKRDAEGKTIAEGFRSVGMDPERISEAKKPSGYYRAYLEMHVEQGNVLDTREESIGIVEGIAGYSWLKATLSGRAGHAGATPMLLRKDALAAAAEIILQTENIALDMGDRTVATVGKILAHPNSINVVPGSVDLAFDIRDVDNQRVIHATDAIMSSFTQICKKRKIEGTIQESLRTDGVHLPKRMTELVERAASKTGKPYRKMISGAAHDANIMAKITDVGMIFAPSQNGISHSPDEWTDKRHISDCSQALLYAVEYLLQEPST